MATGWSAEATRVLITIWEEQNIQEQLDNVSRNKTIYERISAAMREKGFDFDYTVKIRVLLQHPIKIEICVGCHDSTEGV